MDKPRTDDYDGPWKEAIETYFEDCLAFFFPQAHSDIDWGRGYRFLDKEFQKIVPEAELGRRAVDKLVEVWLRNGQEVWVLIHLEVQSHYVVNFSKRMYIYNYRLFDRYDRRVASLAILGDDSPTWRPDQYGYALWDCEVKISYPVVKLLDYREPAAWAALEQSRNPFAVVVMAHLHTQATRHKPDERYALKWQLTRRLYEQGYSKKDVRLLFRFIDWLMALPAAMKYKFEETLIAYEEAKEMPYITSIEEIAIERGLKKGLKQGLEKSILQVLTLRFGEVPPALVEAIKQTDAPSRLEKLLEQAILVASPAEFEQALARNASEDT